MELLRHLIHMSTFQFYQFKVRPVNAIKVHIIIIIKIGLKNSLLYFDYHTIRETELECELKQADIRYLFLTNT